MSGSASISSRSWVTWMSGRSAGRGPHQAVNWCRPLAATARATATPSGWFPRIANRIGTITPDDEPSADGCSMNPDWMTRYDLMVRVAKDAGCIALGYYPDLKAADFSAQVIWKSDNSPVTVADRETEAHLRKELLDAFPADGFLGEESGDRAGTTGYRWIVDPIDGTRNFVRGVPHWATLVGLEYSDTPIAGVVYEPVIDRTWRALQGAGAFRD